MFLIKFVTKDVKSDIKNLYDITVKLIDSNREAKDEVKKTMTAVNAIKDIIIKLFKKGEK
jgi:ATP-dependent protease HslVU (ClpYQ) ATPase subunit